VRLRRRIAASALALAAAAGTATIGSIADAATTPATSAQNTNRELHSWYRSKAECEKALADMHVGPPEDYCEPGPTPDVWYMWMSG
jgi:hypothetical protein